MVIGIGSVVCRLDLVVDSYNQVLLAVRTATLVPTTGARDDRLTLHLGVKLRSFASMYHGDTGHAAG
ncbi:MULTISPECIES: hypothetical protein [unclassified Streptomyces]|uniref:hypothetical protein n=1 Tax=unclassified Streptomyces TaxID=2593676 RepID=UPI000A571DF7|nr:MULTISPECIES: hypothetical protein [unclassified Streptomyces]MYZ38281.1 hypothetical protein [Streptomyces sp. SID4917]